MQGNYSGNGGQLFLQSAVGDDNSPADKLVVNDGTLTGSTLITVTNLGGTGGLTQQYGIELVKAQGTAVSPPDAAPRDRHPPKPGSGLATDCRPGRHNAGGRTRSRRQFIATGFTGSRTGRVTD